jgi:diguanylate cyclase (GGDEF)-like protein
VTLYRLLDSIPWVREHLARKLGVLLFVASQLTLLIYVCVKLAFDSPLESGMVLLLASFNLGAWVAGYVAMRWLFGPVEQTAAVLRAGLERREMPALPQHHQDVIGQLMRDATYLARRVRDDAEHLQYSANTDPITGFYTRGAGKRRLAEDIARADRHKMAFHFAFISLHGLEEPAAIYGNESIDHLLAHVAQLLQSNIRRSDWAARWNEHLFAIGFYASSQVFETALRLQNMIEQSPVEILPGVTLTPTVACGVGTYVKGASVIELRTVAAGALTEAQAGLDSADPRARVIVSATASAIDAELNELLE